jgi:hypothetical protein
MNAARASVTGRRQRPKATTEPLPLAWPPITAYRPRRRAARWARSAIAAIATSHMDSAAAT